MTVARWNVEGIEAVGVAVAGKKGKASQVADPLRGVQGDKSLFGDLDSAQAMATAVGDFANKSVGQCNKASTLLDEVAKALDAVVQTVTNNEDKSAQQFGVQR
ncbi:hypothetical protein EV193_103730 [Herbihabitans rhizosphaerae]|uniref:Excreted virulence factor EspC (Type VII ESX diderm) n=1 Tax=Herbihabitans rhizosphaerae TaxID=1872711 RepID=A0A4Q7KXE9_9PSEU|nr:hypothetical protein [Herbihabitans rhizosphaerae]RZS41407.1 hypothetical protein EV193_103730 [Herbihabitans rhizosphaerae]